MKQKQNKTQKKIIIMAMEYRYGMDYKDIQKLQHHNIANYNTVKRLWQHQ